MDGKITDIAKQLNEFSKFINSNMESIGKSISNNLIDKLKEASNALNTVTKGNTTGQKVARFKTGGHVGKLPAAGALAVVDSGELILNESDTKNMLKAVDTVRGLSEKDLNGTPSAKPDLSKYKDFLSDVSFAGGKFGIPSLSANVKTNVPDSLVSNKTETSTVNNDFNFTVTIKETGNPQKAVDLMYKQFTNGLKNKGLNFNNS